MLEVNIDLPTSQSVCSLLPFSWQISIILFIFQAHKKLPQPAQLASWYVRPIFQISYFRKFSTV